MQVYRLTILMCRTNGGIKTLEFAFVAEYHMVGGGYEVLAQEESYPYE